VKKIKLSEASKPLAAYAAEIDDEMIVITSDGKPLAAVIPLKHLENVDAESLALSASRAFMEIIEGARSELRTGKTLSLDEMKRAVLP
jgi:PHD/YefM family antitoxin component YafN of YafNO toxin-antitoxin module